MTTELEAAAAALKPEPMSEDELEREAREVAKLFNNTGAENGLAFAVMRLAKRYKGE